MVLSHGSRTLMPSAWADKEPEAQASGPAGGTMSDLMEAVALLSVLWTHHVEAGEQTARQSPRRRTTVQPAQSVC